MMMEAAVNILKEKELKITSQRLSILQLMLADTSKAYSSVNLWQSLEKEMNKSTIYRSLETLVEKKIIKKMVASTGEQIYSLAIEEKCEHKQHPHLRCVQCGVIECLPSFPEEYVTSLTSFGVENFDMVLSGTCSKCASK